PPARAAGAHAEVDVEIQPVEALVEAAELVEGRTAQGHGAGEDADGALVASRQLLPEGVQPLAEDEAGGAGLGLAAAGGAASAIDGAEAGDREARVAREEPPHLGREVGERAGV